MPEGRRFAADPVEGKAPAWRGPDPDCMEYLAGRKVMTLGIIRGCAPVAQVFRNMPQRRKYLMD